MLSQYARCALARTNERLSSYWREDVQNGGDLRPETFCLAVFYPVVYMTDLGREFYRHCRDSPPTTDPGPL